MPPKGVRQKIFQKGGQRKKDRKLVKNTEKQHYTYFYKNNFIRSRGSILLKILEQIKNNPASTEEQSLKFSVKA